MAESDNTITVGVELVGTNSIDSKAFWLDLLDRTGKTFIQTLLIFLAGGATITSVSWTTALSSAVLAALVSFLIALSTSTAITSGNFAIDLADRVARTFVSALVGAIPVTGTLADINWRDALTLAATAALVSVLTSLASSNFGPSKGLPSLAPVQPEVIALDDTISDSDGRPQPRWRGDSVLEPRTGEQAIDTGFPSGNEAYDADDIAGEHRRPDGN